MNHRYFALLALALVVACGEGGTQGPGTEIPDGHEAPVVDNEPALPDEPAEEREDEAPPSEGQKPTDPVETPPVTAPPLNAAKKVLDVKWYGQETYYWCGPGSTRIALGTRLANPPSQTTLANFMGTTINGTDHIGLPVRALNNYRPGQCGYDAAAGHLEIVVRTNRSCSDHCTEIKRGCGAPWVWVPTTL